MSSVGPDDDARTALMYALVERFLDSEGLDIAVAEVVEAGLW